MTKTQFTILLRRFVYLALGELPFPLPRVSVFCYHGVGTNNWRFDIDKSEFEKQILFLKTKFNIITIAELEDYLSGKTKITRPSCVISFDDAYESLLSIKDFCKSHKINPIVFALANPLKANRTELDNPYKLMTFSQLKLLKNSGWTIGSHTITHADLTKINREELTAEVSESKLLLEKSLGCKINYFAYPKGAYTENIASLVKKSGYKLALSMDAGFISLTSNKFALPRIGVDRSHTFNEFKFLASYPIVLVRRLALYTPFAKSII